MEAGSRQSGDPLETGRVVDVALAEFNALRSEIVGYITTQAALVGLALTAVGVILGFTVKEHADQRLLLAIPVITLLVVLLHTAATFRSARIGRYIGEDLWPYLERQVGCLPSWEAKVAERRQRRLVRLAPETFLIDFPAMTIFILASGYALVQVGVGGLLWGASCFALALAIVAPLGFSLQIRGEAKSLGGRQTPSGNR